MEALDASIPWLTLNSLIHTFEEAHVPLPSTKQILWGGIFGIPLVVLLHDTSHKWMPKTTQIPIVSWFMRRWRRSPSNKAMDTNTFRNGLIFLWIMCAFREGNHKETTLDYVVDRLTNSTTRRTVNQEITTSRSAAFAASTEIMTTAALDDVKARQQRDAVLRRRHIQDSRNLE